MQLEYKELENLILDVNMMIRSNIEIENRMGTLEGYLKSIRLWDKIYGYEDEQSLSSYPYGKILVIGGSKVKKNHLLGILKDLGIDEERFECILDYTQAGSYNFERLKNSEYRVILAGPMPHSVKGKDEYSSIIEKIRSDKEYPRVEELISNNELKITKTNFKETLQKLLKEKYII